MESSGEGGCERFGEMATVMFIGGHSCGAVADDGIAKRRRLVSMMILSTCKQGSDYDPDSSRVSSESRTS